MLSGYLVQTIVSLFSFSGFSAFCCIRSLFDFRNQKVGMFITKIKRLNTNKHSKQPYKCQQMQYVDHLTGLACLDLTN